MATDVFDLYGKIKLDTADYETSLKKAEGSFEKVGDTIKSALGTITKTTAAAVGAGAAAAGKIVSDAVHSYGEYEQLVGGIETLFKDSSGDLISYAENAYRTAGISANEYMDTAIGFSGALLRSLGNDTVKAAELTQTAITDMADQANKYGKTVQEVSQTYTSLARGNFQTLDNLFGGMFAGTKTGLRDMLDYAEQYRASMGDTVIYSEESYADIVSAIHDVSEATGVMGTTAKEAEGTLQGSVGSVKAAWKNLTVELAKDDGDIAKSIDILFNSALTVFDNVEPRIEKALGGVGAFVEKAAPVLSEKLPPIIEKIMPSLINTGATLVTSIGKGVAKAIPSLLNSGKTYISGVYSDFANSDLGSFDWIREDIVRVVDTVQDKLSGLDFSDLKPVIDWVTDEAIPTAFDAISKAFETLGKALDIVKPVAKDVWEYFLKPLGEWTGDAATTALEKLGKAFEAVGKAIDGVDWTGFWDEIGTQEYWADWGRGWKDISENIDKCGKSVDEFFDVNENTRKWNKFWQGVGAKVYSFQHDKWEPFVEGAVGGFEELERVGGKLYDKVHDAIDFITEGADNIKQGVKDLITDLGDLWNKWLETFGSIGETVFDANHDDEGNFDPFKIFRKLTNIDIPFAANGTTLSSGQAIIAESGPELLTVRNGIATVTPVSVNSQNSPIPNNNTINYNVNVYAQSLDSGADLRLLAHRIGEELEQERIRYQRAVGGVGWS